MTAQYWLQQASLLTLIACCETLGHLWGYGYGLLSKWTIINFGSLLSSTGAIGSTTPSKSHVSSYNGTYMRGFKNKDL